MAKIIDKLLEAYRRGFWKADLNIVEELEKIKRSIEKYIEDLHETMYSKHVVEH